MPRYLDFITAGFVAVLLVSNVSSAKIVQLALLVSNYVFKVGVEVVMTPVTYAVVGWLKRAEGIDIFDRDTDFNPFRVAAGTASSA